jgi:hypothetical protein
VAEVEAVEVVHLALEETVAQESKAVAVAVVGLL